MADRNFDELAHRFKRNVYDRLKGEIRLSVLTRDIGECVPAAGLCERKSDQKLTVLDAGGGQGQFSQLLAAQGHRVLLCDISEQMLAMAESNARSAGVAGNMVFQHRAIQTVCGENPGHFDLVMCHAVLEWVEDPQQLLDHLVNGLGPGGFLSLSYYNVNSIIMKNLLRTNFAKVLAQDYKGYRGSLTPTNPLQPEVVEAWLRALPLIEHCKSGIRCFHDYILDSSLRTAAPEDQLTLELRLSRCEPYRSLARYIHIVAQKTT